jgi:uncharacterized membrane protein
LTVLEFLCTLICIIAPWIFIITNEDFYFDIFSIIILAIFPILTLSISIAVFMSEIKLLKKLTTQSQ